MGKVTKLPVKSLCRPNLVNLDHDLIGKPDCVCNGADRGWYARSGWERCQFASGEDCSSNQQNAVSPLIHGMGFCSCAFSSSMLVSLEVREAQGIPLPVPGEDRIGRSLSLRYFVAIRPALVPTKLPELPPDAG